MPKLLNANSYHYRRGGSDVVYLEHASLMAGLGWDNAFFSMRHPKNLPCEWEEFFVDELEFGNSYSMMSKIRMATKVIYSYEAQRKLRLLLARFRPDVAHLHCIYHHLSPSILPVLKSAGVPVVMTAHDLKIACPAYKMLNRGGICERCREGSVINVVRHRCVRDSLGASVIVAAESGLHRLLNTYKNTLDAVVVPSRFFERKFVEWGWPSNRFRYIPNYVDAAAFSPQFDAGAYFLYFGRLAPEKGIATLIKAAARAKVTLKIAGTGPEGAALEALAASVGGDIEFLGFKGGEDLHALVRGSRAVVLPSEWYENAPMSVLESFALGKPVIGAQIGGIPEMVVPGESGWTFESGSVDDLAELLARVAGSSPGAVADLGNSARALVARQFDRESYVRATLALYAELGAGRGA